MGVGEHRAQPPAPPGELFAVDAYLREFDADIVALDRDQMRLSLNQTAFYPGGGGQPHDVGTLQWDGGTGRVVRVGREGGRVWHWLDGDELPDEGSDVHGTLDWERRHLLMRTHTALHVLCGVIWADYRVAVTGGNMEPGTGRLDFKLDAMSVDLGKRVEARINDEIARARDVLVDYVDRGEADHDEALIRTSANLIPREIDPLRVIEIVGLDKQADGGTHVLSTSHVGRVEVTKTESKGRDNKRIRLAIHDADPLPPPH